jgi:hypothetical protein
MSHARLVVFVLVGSALAASGCGGATKSSSSTAPATVAQSSTATPSTTTSSSTATSPVATRPLSRAQLIATANSICFGLNAKRKATRISSALEYERLVPQLATYELAAAEEMSKITPPAAMVGTWKQIVAGTQVIAEVTGHFRHYSEASDPKTAHVYDVAITKAIQQVQSAAKQAGLTECAQFS